MVRNGYKVTDQIQKAHDGLRVSEKVKKALSFLVDDQALRLSQQVALAQIPAPTYQEEKRAAAYCTYLKDLGLEDVHIDPFGNAIGVKKGAGGGVNILVEAHLDTVFPIDTPLEPQYAGTKVSMPGINDNASGLAAILSVIRALNHGDLLPVGDIYFAGTVEEEGFGAMGGMKALLASGIRFDASISVDCGGFAYINYKTNGIRTCEINFHGTGGHASGAFGSVASALYAAARAAVKISEIPAPPQTICCVSNIHSGSDTAVNSFDPAAQIKINYRSHSQESLEMLHDQIVEAVEQACREESARLGVNKVTWDQQTYINLKAVAQDDHAPIVESLYAVYQGMGAEPDFWEGAACNASRALEAGIQAVCMGTGGEGNTHRLDEYYDSKDMFLGAQSIFLLMLLMAGAQGIIEPQCIK